MAQPNIDKASLYLKRAYRELSAAGVQEQFFTLATDVCSKQWGRYFGHFDGNGCYLEFSSGVNPQEIIMKIGVVRNRLSWIAKLKLAVAEFWSALRGREVNYSVYLADRQLTDLKNMLRMLRR